MCNKMVFGVFFARFGKLVYLILHFLGWGVVLLRLKCYGGATYLSSQGVLSITPKKDIYRVKRGKARACSIWFGSEFMPDSRALV